MADDLRVLVVDDEEGMRLGIERVLRGYRAQLPDLETDVGFVVELAGTAEAGLEAIGARRPDILLLDHKLPGMSGLDLLSTLNERKLDVLTIMITAYASLQTAIVATKRGAYDFLAKPFTPDELKASIRKAGQHLVLQEKARKAAEEKRKVRFEFISVLAHELKAPLASVEGNLTLMKEGYVDDPKSAAQLVDRSLERLSGMRKLIYDLLDMTRIEAGTRTRELRELDLADVARAAMDTVRADATARAIAVELRTEGATVLRADRSEMEIVFNNLLSNAVKYNREGGRVDVAITGAQGSVEISVSDTGIGMTKEEASRLFQDFVRIKNERTQGILGSGLGLSIVRKLAALYGGDVRVESTPDVGTTFVVRLERESGSSPGSRS